MLLSQPVAPMEEGFFIFGAILTLILCLSLVTITVYFIYSLIQKSTGHINFTAKNPRLIKEGFELLQQTTFFKSLDLKGKEVLVKHASIIYHNTRFATGTGLSLDKNRSFKVSLVLAMVAMGFENSQAYDSLQRVVVYKDVFYSRRVKAKVRGLSTSSILYLSWKDFEYGFLHSDDRYNLGIHEAAHLLILHGHTRIGVKSDHWTSISVDFIDDKNHNKGEVGLFRDYAFANLDEFWACCVEQFYELPMEFNEQHPNLYHATKTKLGY